MNMEMTDGTRTKGIIYCRVSSWEQVQNTSLSKQKYDCHEYAEKNQIDVVHVFFEEGESAKTADRTEFKKALAYCADKKNGIKYFIVHKLDRFARNQDDHVVTRAYLKRYKVQLRSVTEPIDESTIGRLQEGILSVFAEFDNNMRAERSKNGMIEKAKKGIWTWSAPLGYKRLMKGGNLVVDDDIAPYVKQAFEEFSKGTYSYESLSDFLKERGFRTRQGKNPCAALMFKIISNPIYCGLIRAFNMEIKGAFEPIISEALFYKCQPSGRYKSGKRERENPNFPLRRFVVCTVCNKSLTGSFSTSRLKKKYPYYHHHKQTCPLARSLPKETLEQNFVEFLQSISPQIKYEKLFKGVVRDIWQSNFRRLDAENAKLRKSIEQLEVDRQKVFMLHREGKYTDDEFLEQKKQVQDAINRQKNLLEAKRIEEFNMDEALDYCFRFVRDSGETWKELKRYPALRARFQKHAFPESVSFDGEKFETKKMSLVYKINQQSGANSSKVVTPRVVETRLTP